MKKLNGVYVAMALFGVVNLVDAISVFGGHDVDLPKFQFWVYSVWVLVRNTVGYTLLMSAPALFFGKKARVLLVAIFGYVLLIEVATFYAGSVFHANLASVSVQLLENSSVDEIVEFVKMSATLGVLLGVAAIVAVLYAGSIFLWNARYPEVSRRSFCFGGLLCAPFFLANCLLIHLQYGNWHFGVNQMKYVNFVLGTITSIREGRGIMRACDRPTLPEKLEVEASESDMPDGVFVLGESSTRNNWHLYGYPRPTTPKIDALYATGEVIKFDDVVGTQPDTVGALSLLLTDVTYDSKMDGNWTLAEAYRRAGYRCVLISNQYVWGDTASTLYKIYNGCEERTSPLIEFGKSAYDEKLVDIMEKKMQAGDGRPTIVFLHLSGIHYPVKPERVHPAADAYFSDSVCEAYMEKFSPKVRDRLNRYDDGILYEDKVLGMIIDTLKKRERPTFMFFVSDHGESPRADTWRSYVDVDVYEVPAVLYLSESYRAIFPNVAAKFEAASSVRIQQDEMSYGLLELGLIRGVPETSGRKSFIESDFQGRYPRLINKGKMVYPKDV